MVGHFHFFPPRRNSTNTIFATDSGSLSCKVGSIPIFLSFIILSGPNCVRNGIVIPPGGTYEKTKGPGCFKCTCRRDKGRLMLSCCE